VKNTTQETWELLHSEWKGPKERPAFNNTPAAMAEYRAKCLDAEGQPSKPIGLASRMVIKGAGTYMGKVADALEK